MPVLRTMTPLLMLFGSFCAAATADDSPMVVVKLADGRQIGGAIDSSTTTQELVLRTERSGITLRRPIRWQRIVGVSQGGQEFSLAKLREAAERSRALGVAGRASGVKRIELRGKADNQQTLPPQAAPPPAPQQVVSISFDVAIANWDSYVEVDGLLLDVAPVDANGYLIPADATLQVELFAPQRRNLADAPQSGGDTLELVERWTREITLDEYGPYGARLRLPFGAIHPEIEKDWAASWYGLVHVRLIVPGHGVFDASRDGVRIRPWAPNRDNLEMNTGRRFVPSERVGRHD